MFESGGNVESEINILFSPRHLGSVEIRNRFVHSATYEGLSAPDGTVTEALLKRYERLAKGGVGLIIPGYMFVHPWGKPHPFATGIHRDEMIPGLKQLVEVIKQNGARVFFQIKHAGQQTTPQQIGRTPMGPSSKVRDRVNFFRPQAMSETEIREVIEQFGAAAWRAAAAGADGIQLHAAHGHLINQFLSPFYNDRQDEWGGSPENRFRFIKSIYQAVKKSIPAGMPVIVKLNSHDYTPTQGITPPLAAIYAKWLVDLGVDGLEVSCGTAGFSFMNVCRGRVPTKELLQTLPFWKVPLFYLKLKGMEGKFDLQEAYNLEAAEVIRETTPSTPLILVGGNRTIPEMQRVVKGKSVDFIAMSRPFIRDPFLVRKIQESQVDHVSCISCNRCMLSLRVGIPTLCYQKGIPKISR
jgi:2,4-dienoyl-CoA reductase-like NADH-dependent reductase (Old Yellow Enzyme family)